MSVARGLFRWSGVLLFFGCSHTTLLGSTTTCAVDSDCTPPSACSPDGICVPKPCSTDGDCDPPAIVCDPSVGHCVNGCNIDPSQCTGGSICDSSQGHCCDPGQPSCHGRVDAGAGCNGDNDCAAQPGTVCSGGACVLGCAQTGCTLPMTCQPSGHCAPTGMCARDADCDVASYCTAAGMCLVLPNGGATPCAGGAIDRTGCNELGSVSEWQKCVGPPGPATCPYCVEGSCLHPGVCAAASDCHAGTTCSAGLCSPTAPQCPSTVPASKVLGGAFAAGRLVCVRDYVSYVSTDSYDRDFTIRMGTGELYGEITPLYQTIGVGRPSQGSTVTVHGAVRWNDWYHRWELRPIDWWAP